MKKKSTKKVKPDLRGKKPKKEKSLSDTEESDQKSLEYGERHSLS